MTQVQGESRESIETHMRKGSLVRVYDHLSGRQPHPPVNYTSCKEAGCVYGVILVLYSSVHTLPIAAFPK